MSSKRKFNYRPQRFSNSLNFLILTGLFLVFLSLWGQESWDWLITRMSLAQIFIGAGFAFYLILFWGLGIPYILLSVYQKPAWLYKHKIQEVAENRKKSPKVKLSKAVRVVLINQFLGTLPFLAGVFYLMKWLGYGDNLSIPVWWVALLQVIGMILIQDVLFFAFHWLLHRKYFFKKIHRVHHEYRESIAIATHYVHYLEHLSGNLIPVFAGPVILMAHPFVILFWIMLIVINALHTHSGFAFPWMSYSVHHDWHHFHVNGSFSSIGLTDKLFGTDKDFEKLDSEYRTQIQGS